MLFDLQGELFSFFLYEILVLSQLFKLIINFAIDYQKSRVPDFGYNTYVCIAIQISIYDYQKFKER